jgi:hypothetical protein
MAMMGENGIDISPDYRGTNRKHRGSDPAASATGIRRER